MPGLHRFGVLGGDSRMRFLADSLAADGFPVLASCMDKAPPQTAQHVPPARLIAESTVILLPLPVSRDGKTLFAPDAEEPLLLDDALAAQLRGKAVFGGMLQKLPDAESWQAVAPGDYFAREELQVGNAVPTAEGAVAIAVNEHPAALNGSDCLITGFGRIGKSLALILRGMGANVYGAARKKADLALMRTFGVQPLEYRDIARPFDIVFNTVPHTVLTGKMLRQQKPDTLLIELASAPGGIDRESADRLHLRVIDAPGLPGVVAPKTAALYIKEAVYNMLEE